jgi:hypothetical protein
MAEQLAQKVRLKIATRTIALWTAKAPGVNLVLAQKIAVVDSKKERSVSQRKQHTVGRLAHLLLRNRKTAAPTHVQWIASVLGNLGIAVLSSVVEVHNQELTVSPPLRHMVAPRAQRPLSHRSAINMTVRFTAMATGAIGASAPQSAVVVHKQGFG